MKRNWPMLRASAVTAIVLLIAASARAAEESGAAEQTTGSVFKWIHFVVLAGVAYWLFTKVLPPVFRHNADRISAAISKAAAARVEAEQLLKDATAKLASLEQEMAHFRSQAQAEAVAELERLRTATKIDIEKIRMAAKAEIEAAERAARVELKALAAKLAVDRAEALVSKELTPAVQDAMINHFVQSLQGRPN